MSQKRTEIHIANGMLERCQGWEIGSWW